MLVPFAVQALRQIEVPYFKEWVMVLGKEGTADVLSENAAILVLGYMLPEAGCQVSIARVTADSHDALSPMSCLDGLKQEVEPVQGNPRLRGREGVSFKPPEDLMKTRTLAIWSLQLGLP